MIRRRMLVIGSGSAATVTPWYLSGGIAAANCIGAYLAKGAASLAVSYVNLAKPGTYDLTAIAAPTWAAETGWTGDASKGLQTGITPASDQTWSMIVRYSDVSNNGTAAGCQTGDGQFRIIPDVNGTSGAIYNGKGAVYPAKLLTGIMAVAGNKGYRDGVAVSGTCTAWTGAATTIGILCNYVGRIDTGLAGSIQAAAIYNVVLSQDQITALVTAMNTL